VLQQGQILEISLSLAARDFDDDDPDCPPCRRGRGRGRTPTRGRSDHDGRQDRKRFGDHYGPLLSDITPKSVRLFNNLLCHICHSCNRPLLQLDAIVATTTDLCKTNVPGPERKQDSMKLYFKLASHGVLPKVVHSVTWLNMFAVCHERPWLRTSLSVMPSCHASSTVDRPVFFCLG
jgi:hypothetical protein